MLYTKLYTCGLKSTSGKLSRKNRSDLIEFVGACAKNCVGSGIGVEVIFVNQGKL